MVLPAADEPGRYEERIKPLLALVQPQFTLVATALLALVFILGPSPRPDTD